MKFTAPENRVDKLQDRVERLQHEIKWLTSSVKFLTEKINEMSPDEDGIQPGDQLDTWLRPVKKST